ncbi:hypothetical protein ACMYSO_12005 [Klebsiella sp. B345]|uniref:HofO family protein n=1 Tax=Klebsiella sp. B345 TaxID=2755398 RepID=UPI003DA94FDE
MRATIEHWWGLLCSGRGGQLALPFVLVLLVAGYFWFSLSPPPVESHEPPGIRLQWLRLMPLQVASPQDSVEERVTQRFSPMTLPGTDSKLVAWRPVGRGGELVLDVRWQAVPPLFLWLAQCGMRVTAFSLHPHKGSLQMTLALEADHED